MTSELFLSKEEVMEAVKHWLTVHEYTSDCARHYVKLPIHLKDRDLEVKYTREGVRVFITKTQEANHDE